jgi:hypothetical protein
MVAFRKVFSSIKIQTILLFCNDFSHFFWSGVDVKIIIFGFNVGTTTIEAKNVRCVRRIVDLWLRYPDLFQKTYRHMLQYLLLNMGSNSISFMYIRNFYIYFLRSYKGLPSQVFILSRNLEYFMVIITFI